MLLVWVEPAAPEPWDSSCRSQIDNVESAAQAALRAQQEVTDAYEEYEQKREDLRSCLLFPDVYDLMQDGCRSRRWDAQTARDELNWPQPSFSPGL